MYKSQVHMRKPRTYLASVSGAIFKYTRVIVCWHIPLATHLIVDVLAQCRGVRAISAGAEAELSSRHEILYHGDISQLPDPKEEKQVYRQFMYLHQLAGECIREDNTSNRIS